MSGSTVSVDRSNQPSGRWFLTEEQLASLPSIVDGLSVDEEARNRQKAASFITEMAERLNQNVKDRRSRISQLCICTAMVFMHRFFTVHSMKKFDYRDIAAACLFLAGKSEETPRKLEHIVHVWWRLKFSNQVILDRNVKRYFDAAQVIVTLENCVLQTLGFDLTVQVPHTFVLMQMNDSKVSKKFTEIAYWFATDILHITNWVVRFHASKLACICIYLAFSWGEFDVPQKNVEKSWYNKMSSLLSEEELQKLIDEFTAIYLSCSESLAINKFEVRNGVIFERSRQRSTTSSTAAPQSAAVASGSSESAAQPAASASASGSGAPMLPPPPAPPSLEKEKRKVGLSEYKRSIMHTDEAQKQSSSGSSSQQQPRKSFMPDTTVVKNVPELLPAFGKDGSKVYGKVPPPSSNTKPPTPSDDRHRRKETSSSSHHQHQSSGSRHSRTEGDRDRPTGSASSSSASNQQHQHRKRAHDRTSEQHSNGSRHENGNQKRPRPSLASDHFGAPISANDATPPQNSNSLVRSGDESPSRPYGNGSSANGPAAPNSGFPAVPTKNTEKAFGASSDDLEDGEIN